MKLVPVLILIIVSLAAQARGITIQSRTAGIYHRYYLIKRLEQSCTLLGEPSVKRLIPFYALDASLYASDDIRVVIDRMKEEKSTDAFFELWQDFCGYKNIYDDSFKNELIQLIYTLYNSICPMRMQKIGDTLERALFAIDCASDSRYATGRPFRGALLQELEEVTTDFIAKRFYVLKRLQKSIDFLGYLHAKKFQFQALLRNKDNAYDAMQELERFQHDRVRESVAQMFRTKNLEPLLLLCAEAKQYRFAQDENFLQEMLMNIFLVYKTILLKNGSHHADPAIIEEINHVLQIYENLSTMPLDQTLEAIDEVTDRLIAIQAERASRPYLQWGIAGAMCALIGSAVFYFVQQR